jgi:hypothetical protein
MASRIAQVSGRGTPVAPVRTQPGATIVTARGDMIQPLGRRIPAAPQGSSA